MPENLLSLGETVMRPGLIWGCAASGDGITAIEDCDAPADGGLRWLHLNLSDHRSLRWIEEKAKLPPLIRDLMRSKDEIQRALVQKGVASWSFTISSATSMSTGPTVSARSMSRSARRRSSPAAFTRSIPLTSSASACWPANASPGPPMRWTC